LPYITAADVTPDVLAQCQHVYDDLLIQMDTQRQPMLVMTLVITQFLAFLSSETDDPDSYMQQVLGNARTLLALRNEEIKSH
jgi:hypothetical protein